MNLTKKGKTPKFRKKGTKISMTKTQLLKFTLIRRSSASKYNRP